MAGSPAATTTSVGFWRKSSRSTNATKEGKEGNVNRSDDTEAGTKKDVQVHTIFSKHKILNYYWLMALYLTFTIKDLTQEAGEAWPFVSQ